MYLCGAKISFSAFPGVFSAFGGETEIIPVEPDQGNACAGRNSSPVAFPFHLINQNKK